MLAKRFSDSRRSRMVWPALLAVLLVSCDFAGGIVLGARDLVPLSTPTPDPADAELLPNGLTVAEAANAGRHAYAVRDAETRSGFGAINRSETVEIHHEFSVNTVEAISGDGSPVVFTRIDVNTYQGPHLELSSCPDVLFIRIFGAEGFSNFFQCQTDESVQALVAYTIVDE